MVGSPSGWKRDAERSPLTFSLLKAMTHGDCRYPHKRHLRKPIDGPAGHLVWIGRNVLQLSPSRMQQWTRLSVGHRRIGVLAIAATAAFDLLYLNGKYLDESAKLSLTIREVRALRSRFGLRSLFLNETFRPHISPRSDRINNYPQTRERVVDLALDALSLRS